MAANGNHDGLRKALFRSPNQPETNAKETDEVQQIMSMIDVDVEVETGLRTFKRELHEQNLAKLRRELEKISMDQWRYKAIDQLIGF